MKGTKEFYDLMHQFEKDIKQSHVYGHNIEREKGDNLPKGIFYQDGYINTLFQFYMMGYSLGKLHKRR